MTWYSDNNTLMQTAVSYHLLHSFSEASTPRQELCMQDMAMH